MVLFVKITTPQIWAVGDYTDDTSLDINATVYSDQQMTTTVDLTQFTTITMRLIDPNHNGLLVFDTTSGVSGDANGVLTWTPSDGSQPYVKGLVKIRPRFENSTEKLTAIGVAGSDEIFIKKD